ncbi:hypothetical protein [Micromonospora tulbaghiae]|uniref:hypothetical protein n=1 Tax=Micromonospora tulbaghiae TaxID=479978 RepID=UPI0013C4D4E4|nr:hypothetical protein [Micromonospora tulbaghiae]
MEQIDCVGALDKIDVELPYRVEQRHSWDYPALVIAAGLPRDQWRPVHVPVLGEDDPWQLIYAATLGVLPQKPDPALFDPQGTDRGVRFETFIPVEWQPLSGSLDDLLHRLESHDILSPRRFSNVQLAAGQHPDTGFLGLDAYRLPSPDLIRRAGGPNIVVVVSPGSVEDIALLWNLRAAHGDHHVLPIGIPVADVSQAALRSIRRPGRAVMFGLGGGHCYLTSASLTLEKLTAIAASGGMKATPYEDLLQFGLAPARPQQSQAAQWTDGRTRLSVVSDGDREVLEPTDQLWRQPTLVADVRVSDWPIPTDTTMRGNVFDFRYQAGAAQAPVSQRRGLATLPIQWPPTWTSLAAVAQSRGLRVEPSEPGLAAETLIRTIGGVENVRLLAHAPLIALLYRLAERSGMNWWKDRWTRTHRELRALGVSDEQIEAAAARFGRDEPAIAPAGEGRAVPFGDFKTALGRNQKAAVNWVGWAERHHLLVRGTTVGCADCHAKSWVPLASAPPPVGCPGCGRLIHQPYGPESLQFTYRIGEPLRRVLETDTLGHVLTLRWLFELFRSSGTLVGAHPGVNFYRDSVNLGEADVLLLFADGRLVPAEVKRRSAGMNEKQAKLLDSLSDGISAPYDIIAVTQPARDCNDLLQFARAAEERPRLLLTDDQLHEEKPFSSLGRDPFRWNPIDLEAESERQKKFVARLAQAAPENPPDWVSESLLTRDLPPSTS